MREEGNNVAIREVGDCEPADKTDDGGDKDGGDKEREEPYQLLAVERLRGKYDKRDGEEGQLAEEVVETIRDIVGPKKPKDVYTHQYEKSVE